MSALFTADIHLSANPRDAYRLDWCDKVLPKLIDKHKVKTLIIGGDLTEEKDRHTSWLVNHIAAWVVAMTDRCEVIIYKGNHDYVSEDDPFFMFLGLLPRVTFYSNPRHRDVEGVGTCLFLPHTRDYKRDWTDVLDQSRRFRKGGNRYARIFAHNSFTGAKLGNGRLAVGIPTDIFDRKDNVLAGDIHIPQDIDQVRYAGAPYTVDFGDDYMPRVLILNGSDTKSVPCDGPQKLLLTMGLKDNLDYLERCDVMKGDVVKVRVHVRKYDPRAWQTVVDGVRAWAEEAKVILHTVQPVVADQDGTRVRRTHTARRNDEQVLEDFGKSRGVDGDTMNTGHYIMERAR